MTEQIRQIAHLITGRQTSDGAGVKLKRVFSVEQGFDPFLLFDEFGSDEPADYLGGFPDHPHRGFETVTYMLKGAMLHRDHLGHTGHLRAGDVQWMTAAHGIIHSEMPEQENGVLHGFQLWLNLPAKEKMKPPHYQEFAATEIPHLALANQGYIKIIAGEYNAIQGAVQGVSTQPLYLDVFLAPEQSLSIPVHREHTVLVYVYQGALLMDNQTVSSGQLARLINGNRLHLTTEQEIARFLVLAALPLDEPVVQSGPFVMNTVEELNQAFRDYRNGVLTVLDNK